MSNVYIKSVMPTKFKKVDLIGNITLFRVVQDEEAILKNILYLCVSVCVCVSVHVCAGAREGQQCTSGLELECQAVGRLPCRAREPIPCSLMN